MQRTHQRPEWTLGQLSPLSTGDQADEESSIQTTLNGNDSPEFRSTLESFLAWQDRLCFDTWFIEISFLMISIACFVAIGVVLSIFDGKDAPTLPSGLTMNAIIAIISAASKSALVLVIASSIGQSKWTWYRQSRRLDDAQLFEDASRGPFGSLQLLWRHRGVSFASIGASIIVLASLFEPFTQQILTFSLETVEVNSNLAVAKQARLALTDQNREEFFRAVQAGIWTNDFERRLSCPTGNCTWDTFTSLSMCSKCGSPETPPRLEACTWSPNLTADLSDVLSAKTILCNITFADGYPSQIPVTLDYNCANESESNSSYADTNNNTSCSYSVTWPHWGTFLTDYHEINQFRRSGFPTNESFLGIPNPMMILGQSALYLDDSLTSLHINESTTEICVLNYCLQDYTISMENDQQIVETHNTRYGDTYYSHEGFLDQNATVYGYYCWAAEGETFIWDENNRTQTFNESYGNMMLSDSQHFSFCSLGWFRGIGETIGELLVGNATTGIEYACQAGLSDCRKLAVLVPGTSMGQLGLGVRQIKDNNMTYVMKNIASSLTRFLENTNTYPIYGRVPHVFTKVNVRWHWLVLPGLLIVAGGIFLLMTIITTERSGAPIWKNSVLAFLFTGFENEQLKEKTTTGRVSTMHEEARDMTLGLKTAEGGARIVFGRVGVTMKSKPTPYQSCLASTTSSQIHQPLQPRSFPYNG